MCRDTKMLLRALVILVACWLLFAGCANTEETADPMLRQSAGDREVHGEVGAMYGHSARCFDQGAPTGAFRRDRDLWRRLPFLVRGNQSRTAAMPWRTMRSIRSG